MCGLVGFYSPKGFSTDLLFEMTETIKHRGPDDEGYSSLCFDEKLEHYKGSDTIDYFNSLKHIRSAKKKIKLGLSHRRLSILDLSESGHQPMATKNDSIIIIHNGEIYNYVEIKKELSSLGYKFKTNTDTEIILNAYSEWGEDCVKHFIGMCRRYPS